jgi:hypothetical protein
MSDQPEESWLTYRELGAQLGCTANAARMHAHRRGWPRRAPNKVGDPAHVLVPGSLDVQSRATHDAALFVAQPNGFDRTHVEALVQALDVLREQLTKADQRTDRAERHLEEERGRVDEERKRVDELRTSVTEFQTALADAVAAERITAGVAAGLRAELDRRQDWRAPWWRRWFR